MVERHEGQEQALFGDAPAEVRHLSDDIWLLPRPLGNTVLIATNEGAAVVDPGLEVNGPRVREELRRRTQAPLRLIIYTHGHADHAFGTGALLKDAAERGDPPPEIVGHRRVRDRFDIYQRLQGRRERASSARYSVREPRHSRPCSKNVPSACALGPKSILEDAQGPPGKWVPFRDPRRGSIGEKASNP